MWCDGNRKIAIVTSCLIAASLVSETVYAAPKQKQAPVISQAATVNSQRYTPRQFRAVLRGLGYSVKATDGPLTDAETKKAVRQFQTGYKIQPVDGIAGPKTQEFAANIVRILQANLNTVLKPKTPLPRNSYYGAQTEAAVKEFQKKFQLQETGIADLPLRQKLNEEAQTARKSPASSEPTPTSTPTTKPSTRRKPSARPIPTPTPTATPEVTPEATPTPEATATPEATPEATATPTATPTRSSR
jgi:peptidoglycan hydrolase-like protein with peptidoglycan-binding domain